MSAGTLTLTNNSDVITGSGTNLTTELAAGDFAVVVVGGITYTLPVKSVDSATKLTLVSKYPGPSQNGLAWNAVPRLTQNLITAAVVAQAAEALRGLNYDKQNWQQIFSSTGMATIKLPDGSQFSGPAWRSVMDYIDAVFPVGMRLDWPSLILPDNAALGVKYLRLNGASFNKTLYPKLAAIYPSGVLPDMRGDTIRGYDDARGIDQGRDLLSEQADAIQNITATINARGMPGISTGVFFSAAGAFSLAAASGPAVLGSSVSSGSTAMDVVTFDASRVARTSTETRMRNMAWNMIVRAA